MTNNGDKIRQMSNAELARLNKCECCMYFGGAFCEGVFCNKPNGKTCADGREAWLNAPADAPDTNVGTKESEGKVNVNKLKKLNDIAMALNDLKKTAPPMYQEHLGFVICYLLEQMRDEVEK